MKKTSVNSAGPAIDNGSNPTALIRSLSSGNGNGEGGSLTPRQDVRESVKGSLASISALVRSGSIDPPLPLPPQGVKDVIPPAVTGGVGGFSATSGGVGVGGLEGDGDLAARLAKLKIMEKR